MDGMSVLQEVVVYDYFARKEENYVFIKIQSMVLRDPFSNQKHCASYQLENAIHKGIYNVLILFKNTIKKKRFIFRYQKINHNNLQANVLDCLKDIKLSLAPCSKNNGDCNFFMFSKLLNLSFIMY